MQRGNESSQIRTLHSGFPPTRLNDLALKLTKSRERVEQLLSIARRGLPAAYSSGGFAHTVRLVGSKSKPHVDAVGDNPRYTSIVALGLGGTDDLTQRTILGGHSAAELAETSAKRAEDLNDVGAIALAAWAAAEVAGFYAKSLFDRLDSLVLARPNIATVDCAWIVSAALAAQTHHDTSGLAMTATSKLRAGQNPCGLFPHILPVSANQWPRKHIACFADQVYPIQALARFSVAFQDVAALAAAEACAARICECQGSAGQWWWHYDTRDGSVVERYPVYSVHQHAMAPMALFELHEAGGTDHSPSIIKGLQWLDQHPEIDAELVSKEHNVIWRKVGRREPAKLARKISALTTAIIPGLHLPLLDKILPPSQIDFECRPYELGWLFYAWLSDGAMNALRRRPIMVTAQSGRPPQQAERRLMFGLGVDALRFDEVINRCRHAVETRKPVLLGVINAAKVVSSRKDQKLRQAIERCDLLLADGQSIVWAGRLLKCPLPERIAGIDVFERLLKLAHIEGRSVYLLGAKPTVLQALEERLKTRFPGLRIVGRRDGYFLEREREEVAAEIRSAKPDMLFLGMPSPMKEIFLSDFGPSLNVPVMHGVGGSFDVLAGLTKRAPLRWQRMGLEWAFRLVQEPRRMWWRYLSTNTAFVVLTLRELLRRSPSITHAETHVV